MLAEIQSQADAAFEIERSRGHVVDVLVLPQEYTLGPRNATVSVELSNRDIKNFDVSMPYIDDLIASEETHLLKEALEEWRDNNYSDRPVFSTPSESQ